MGVPRESSLSGNGEPPSLEGLFRREHLIGASAREPAARTRLPLAGPFQRPVDCGQGLRGVDQGDPAQGEAVRDIAGEQVDAPLPLGLRGRDQAGRHARLPLRLLQQRE